ncbi:hypothetical protein BJ508DRAFT_326554 [Ascobolus immersus RN42]|uniref:Uncharacterized protein n=1 Tax=Ascobolus immersus RN42 TaxID=1160509 RepID=A0A3N4I5R1_ASCIM|nr:hypothetical protein BJ508DRAFT_326554 [Ascobolus immersus RN42]
MATEGEREESTTPGPVARRPRLRVRKQANHYVGARCIPRDYIHILDANLRRLFTDNPNPEVPARGYALVKYNRWSERNHLAVVTEAEAEDTGMLPFHFTAHPDCCNNDTSVMRDVEGSSRQTSRTVPYISS